MQQALLVTLHLDRKAYDRVARMVMAHLEHESAVATPGGTGAVSMTIQECLDEGQEDCHPT